MGDYMEEYLEDKKFWTCGADAIYLDDLGLFFWERGGKEYCFNWKGWAETYEGLIECAEGERTNENGAVAQQAQSLLDCVACLGKEKIEKLIEGLKDN